MAKLRIKKKSKSADPRKSCMPETGINYLHVRIATWRTTIIFVVAFHWC